VIGRRAENGSRSSYPREPEAAERLRSWRVVEHQERVDDPRSDDTRADMDETQIELLEKPGYP